jgi:hypothetical protein
MSYVCDGCGEILESEWCDDCELIADCDCSNIVYTRFKDLIIDTDDGEKTVTIRIYHCETCGDVSHVEN